MELAGRVIRRTGVRLVRAGAQRARLAAILVILIGGYAIAATMEWVPAPASLLPSTDRVGYQATADGEPTTTASYLRGQQLYDARLVWDAYSERSMLEIQRQGGSVEQYQRQLDRAKEAGNRIDQIHYVGNYPVPNGSMHFYVVARTGRARGDIAYVPYVFTLDASGKIDKIE
jgi:hypothetical protein